MDNKNLIYFLNNPFKGLLKLTFPILIGMGLHMTYEVVDMIFVGMISKTAIAALGFNIPIFFFVYGLSIGIGTGITALVAKKIGEKNKTEAKKIADHGFFLAISLGILVTSILLLMENNFLLFLNVPLEILKETKDYYKVLAFGFPMMISSIIFRSIYNGEGDSKTPTLVLAAGTISNIILDPILIFKFNLGIQGAALATVVSQFLSFSIFIYLTFIKKINFLRLNFRIKLSLRAYKEIFKMGLPAGLAMIIMSSGIAILNYIVVSFGTDAVAGLQISYQMEHFFFMPVVAIATASTTIVGMFYGTRKIKHLYKIIKYSFVINFSWGLFCIILFNIITPYVYYMFTKADSIVIYSMSYMRVITYIYPLIAIGITTGRILQGLGTSIPMLLTTSLRILIISAPLSYAFVKILNRPITWVWYAIVLSAIFSVVFGLVLLKIRLNNIKDEFLYV
jgi:putative MATE family efflux protein